MQDPSLRNAWERVVLAIEAEAVESYDHPDFKNYATAQACLAMKHRFSDINRRIAAVAGIDPFRLVEDSCVSQKSHTTEKD